MRIDFDNRGPEGQLKAWTIVRITNARGEYFVGVMAGTVKSSSPEDIAAAATEHGEKLRKQKELMEWNVWRSNGECVVCRVATMEFFDAGSIIPPIPFVENDVFIDGCETAVAP